MSSGASVVGLHALGVPVDVRVVGSSTERRRELSEAVRERWHLCLREEVPHPGEMGRADRRALGELEAGRVRVIEAALLADGDKASPWSREETVVHDTELRRLLQRLTQTVTHTLIDARTGGLLMLHAAGLADPETGATAVFVAPGNTGKTTLCRVLGPARAYVSDETIGIRRDGAIEPYPKPLSLRRAGRAGVKDETAPGMVGLRAPAVTPWVAGIILLRRDGRHRGEPVVEDLDLLDALLALIPESSGFMRTEAPLRWLADVLEAIGGARGVAYADAADLEPLVQEICARRSPPWWSPRATTGDDGPQLIRTVPDHDHGHGHGPDGLQLIRAVPAHDELEHQGESLVLLDGQVRRVSPVGTLIRSRARSGATVPDLAEVLTEHFGPPPDGSAEQVTRTAVDTLLEAGLLASVCPLDGTS